MVLPFYIFSEVTSLLTVRIRAGVVVAVALQQVDGSPDAKTGTESDDEGLEYADCTVEKCHNDCLPESLGRMVGNLAFTAKAGTKTAMQLPIPASPFIF